MEYGECISVLLILQRPGKHGSLEGGELETYSEGSKDIYFYLGLFVISDIGTPTRHPQAAVGSGPTAP